MRKMTSKIRKEFSYFKFNPNTVYEVRKEYNLHKQGAMDQAVDILEDWIKKQEHFVKKDLPRGYLERSIISAKGSIEKAKTRIDKLFTMTTMSPKLFEKCHAIKDFPNARNFFICVCMPLLTEDNCRYFFAKFTSKMITAAGCFEACQHCRILCEYAKLYDYAKGYYVVYDLRDVNIADVLAHVDWIEFRTAVTAVVEGYGFRLMSIYIMSSSPMINGVIKLVKQIVSEKIGNRIHVIKDLESLHQHVSTKMLPKEYGGELKPILELYDEMNEELSSEEMVAHATMMKHARTIEELRPSEVFDKEYLGMPGSFKMLSVD